MSENEVDRSEESNENSPFHQKRVIPFEKYLRSLFTFSLIFAALFILDKFLPYRQDTERVEEWFMMIEDAKVDHYIPVYEFGELSVYYKIKTNGNSIALNKDDALRVKKGDLLSISKTPVFRTITSIELVKDSYVFRPYVYGYGFFLIVPFILLLTSVIGLFKRLRDDGLYALAVIQILTLGAFIVMRLFYM